MTAFCSFTRSALSSPGSCSAARALGALLLAGLLLSALVPLGTAQAQAPSRPASADAPLHVGLMTDPGTAADSLAPQIRREVTALLSARRSVEFSVVRTGTALPDTADVLVAVGPGAAATLCAPGAAPDRPVVAVPTGSGLLAPSPEAAACTVVAPQGWPSDTFRAFQRLTDFDHVDVLVDAWMLRHVPHAAERVTQRAAAAGFTARLFALADEIPRSSDAPRAVFLDGMGSAPTNTVRALTQRLADRSIPVFAYDPAHVTHHGALAAPERIARLRARRAALAIESIWTDAPPPADPTARADAPSRRLVINAAVAEAQSIALSWDWQVDARTVNEPPSDGEVLSLARAMQQSIAANLTLRAERQQTEAAANQVDIARADLLPQIDASATGRLVNEDLASSSLGAQPQELLTSSVSLRQVLFSEPLFAKLSVERRMQAMREFERQRVRLDAAQQAADAYVHVLQAEASVRIQRENVRVVRANLDAAQTRRRTGAADPREVSRLETQHARAEQGLLRAMGGLQKAKVQLNRVLNRPLDAAVALDQATGVDPRPVLAQFPYAALLDRPQERTAFRQFWVQEARTRAPEVQTVGRLVRARERQLTSTKRSFWMPTLSVEGTWSGRMYEGGTGTSGASLPLPGSSGFSLPTPPDEQWSIGITARFPLFDGTQRAARQRQASDQLAAAKTRRLVAELGVEQAVRTALIDVETSYEAVQRALRAADAAQRTLDVTQAAYREGTATLVDLIDAQTTALSTRQEASDAAYGLIRDWIAVQRAGGSFRVLRTPQEQSAFERRLHAFVPAPALDR